MTAPLHMTYLRLSLGPDWTAALRSLVQAALDDDDQDEDTVVLREVARAVLAQLDEQAE